MKNYYIGFRIEAYHKLIKSIDRKIISLYNKNKIFSIKDINFHSKIVYSKKDDLVLTESIYNQEKETPFSNFLLMTKVGNTKEDAIKLIKIINVIGNDKIIKEPTKEFMGNDSILKFIEKLNIYKEAISMANNLIPGLIEQSWIYTPELFIKGE